MKAAQPLVGSSLVKGIELVQVPCAGNVEVVDILHALEAGARAVLVVGCPIDNCKYVRGNERTLKRVDVARQAVKDAGYDENRVRMELLSSVDTNKLMHILKEMKAS